MTPKDAAFDALAAAARLDMPVSAARVGIVLTLGLHGQEAPEDILAYATDGVLSDDDIRPGEMALPLTAWADRLEARGL